MKPKILYLMEYPIDLPGGAQLSTRAICDPLSKEGEYEIVVVCPELLKSKKSDYAFRVETYPMGEKRLPNLRLRIKAFREIIAAEKPSLIHIEMSESLITYGFIRRHFPLLPYIYTDRGMYFGYRLRSRLFMMPVLKRAAALVTTTEKNATLWREHTAIRPVETIPNTISPLFETFEPEKKKTSGKLVIGFAGRVCEEKDWDAVPELVRELKKAGIDFFVDLVLSVFEPGDAEVVEKLCGGLREIMGAENFRYRQDLSQEEMSDYYYGVDLFVMTSRFESFGKAAVEAMSRKCAVLATAVGGLPEVVGKEEALYDKEEPSGFVEAVRRFAGDREALMKEQSFFLERYRSLYKSDRYVSRHKELYKRILGGA
ncbi:MAG: glycosyltransferase family 4 protein [Lachnospiraceae bacterium]|nr:glycosyltransferase family 4 protein [Lachnospiraceae bacterium]